MPDLLTEVHWLLENSGCRFVLCGSSGRRLRRAGVTNLAGRLRAARMTPLTFAELPHFDLRTRLQYGCLPPIVVSATTVAEYFQILEDTLLGFFLDPLRRTTKRGPILTRKFYLFDANALLLRQVAPGTPECGKSFEQLLVLETFASMFYDRGIEELAFWRSAAGYEVDLVIDRHTAVEFKSGRAHAADCAGLLALAQELKLRQRWIVCTETHPRRLDNGIEVLPWQRYLERLSELRRRRA